MISPAQKKILFQLHYGAEIIYEDGHYFIGTEQLLSRTVKTLLRQDYVRHYEADNVYRITESGREALLRAAELLNR